MKIKTLKPTFFALIALITGRIALHSSEPTLKNPTLGQRFSNNLQWLFGQKNVRAYGIRQRMANPRLREAEALNRQLEQSIKTKELAFKQAREAYVALDSDVHAEELKGWRELHNASHQFEDLETTQEAERANREYLKAGDYKAYERAIATAKQRKEQARQELEKYERAALNGEMPGVDRSKLQKWKADYTALRS